MQPLCFTKPISVPFSRGTGCGKISKEDYRNTSKRTACVCIFFLFPGYVCSVGYTYFYMFYCSVVIVKGFKQLKNLIRFDVIFLFQMKLRLTDPEKKREKWQYTGGPSCSTLVLEQEGLESPFPTSIP